MHAYPLAVAALLCLGIFLPDGTSLGQGNDQAKADLHLHRQRLTRLLKPGMSADQVLKVMGKPDEVLQVSEVWPFDRSWLGGVETQRWVYGIAEKGTFARIGYVSMDSHGKVVTTASPDVFAGTTWKLPERVPATGELAVATSTKLSCHAGTIQFHPKKGASSESIETTITLKNAGAKRFELKHDAASTMRRFLLVEVYDATGLLVYRMDEMLYHSQISFDPADWPVLVIEPGKEISDVLHFSPSWGFGTLPPGKYSLGVYFPFEKGKYYPSNTVRFEVKEEDRNQGQKQ
jgi:hypothetical protein